jgi:hypothetical protein
VRSVALALLVGLAACSGDGASAQRGEGAGTTSGSTAAAVVGAVDGPVMRHPAPSSSGEGMAAEVRGVLQLEGACLYVFLDEVGQRYPVLWPAGTSWDEGSEAVIPPAGLPMDVGSQVRGSGGYLYLDDVELLAGPEAAALASSCVDNDHGEIAVVNNQDTAIEVADD